MIASVCDEAFAPYGDVLEGYDTQESVSYTHLDVYKRQVLEQIEAKLAELTATE